MSTPKKFLIGAVSLILAVAFVMIMVTITNKGKNSINNSTAQFDHIVSQYSDIQLSMYENTSVSGSQVVDLIHGLTEDSGYSITVINGENQKNGSSSSSGHTYSYGSEDVSKIEEKTSSEYYINPNAAFDSTVTRDKNGIIIAVQFVQQK